MVPVVETQSLSTRMYPAIIITLVPLVVYNNMDMFDDSIRLFLQSLQMPEVPL